MFSVRNREVIGLYLGGTNSGRCTILVQLLSACCPLFNCTYIVQIADNKRTTTGVGPVKSWK